MSGFYAADGSWRVSVVDGTTRTGRYAADNSLNIIASDGLSPHGRTHRCGAMYVTVAPSGYHGINAPDGSLYVSESPYTNKGQHVTVVSGSLSGGASTAGTPMGLLLLLTHAS